jgi:small conductance mechanosensitive channel
MIDVATKKLSPVDLYTTAYNWLLNNGPRLLFGIFVFLIGLWVIRFLKRRIRAQMTKKKIHSSLQPFFLSLTITLLHILLIIVVMEIMGIQLTILTAIVGAGSVALGLALSGTLQNFSGGVLILLLKPFTIEDNIVAQGVDGVVTSIEVFYTEVLTADNKAVIIPNGKLFNEVIVNVTREGKRRLDLEIKLTYAIDIEQVKGVIDNAIKQTPNILPEPAPNIGVLALEIDGIKISVRVWVNNDQFGNTRFILQEKIIKDLAAAGVKLPGM